MVSEHGATMAAARRAREADAAKQALEPRRVVGTRVVAGLIDFIVLTGLFFLFAAVFGDFGSQPGPTPGSTTFAANVTGWPAVALFAVSLGYFIVAEAAFGATLGKMALGLRVVDVDGHRIGVGASVIRNLLRPIDGLPIFYIVGIVTVAISSRDQRLGDMAARTLVVATDSEPPSPDTTTALPPQR